MPPPSPWAVALALAALSIPLTFVLAALLVARADPFRGARLASGVAASLALLVALGGAWSPGDAGTTEVVSSLAVSLVRATRLDVVASVMLLLVCALGVVVVRYSCTYLQGDAGQRRYVRALLATLAAVTLLVIANHLLVMALAWTATSLGLHSLLTFYRDRPQALLAAHKKFLLSRLADACMVGALALLAPAVGSLHLDDVQAWARSRDSLPPAAEGAALLLVAAACLKSAQLPFHGWLTQVMEAPTPVSALLHAGLVNLGGFWLLRLAPLLARAPLAQTVLVMVGTTTAVVAALVMMTRVSVKVALAWSTCAQMGLLLVECGLGAWHLALLHLVAHSVYKAHAFLRSGSAVERWRTEALSPRPEPLARARVLVTLGVALAGVAAARTIAAQVTGTPVQLDVTLDPLALLPLLSLSLLVTRGRQDGWRSRLGVAGQGVAVIALHLAWQAASLRLLPRPSEPPPPHLAGVVATGGFALLFAVQLLVASRPEGRLGRALQPCLFAGLYLDEIFTRMTFRLWPPRLPRPQAPPAPLSLPVTQQA